jgi:small subunit ribosomal protein S13
MIYLLNTHLDTKKPVCIALTRLYGLGSARATQICDACGIPREKRLSQCTPRQVEQLTEFLTEHYDIGLDVKRVVRRNVERLVRIASIRGFRHIEGLPLRGQRTHGNARTARRVKWHDGGGKK